MSTIATKTTSWYRVIIDDPRLAMSTNFRLLVEMALRHAPSSAVKNERLEIVPNTVAESIGQGDFAKVLPIDSLLTSLGSIAQLVWGRFFFFETNEGAEQADKDELAGNIAASQMTICVVDNSSCFVFTKSTSLVCELLSSYLQVEVTKDDLSRILARQEDF
jgi:hypothetical protein